MKNLILILVAIGCFSQSPIAFAKSGSKTQTSGKKAYQKVPPSESVSKPPTTSPEISETKDNSSPSSASSNSGQGPLDDSANAPRTAPSSSASANAPSSSASANAPSSSASANAPSTSDSANAEPTTPNAASSEPSNSTGAPSTPDTKSSETKENSSNELAAQDTYGKADGIFGKFLIGPNITLLGAPTPFRFGVETKFDNLFGVSFDYGLLPNLTFSDVKIKYNSWRVAARIFPFRGGFYLGIGYGKQKFTGASQKETAGTTVNYDLTVDTTILVPQIGWRWTSTSGFFFGMELGVQLASSSQANFSSDAPQAIQATNEYATNKKDIEDSGKLIGQTTLPHVALVQIGWFL